MPASTKTALLEIMKQVETFHGWFNRKFGDKLDRESREELYRHVQGLMALKQLHTPKLPNLAVRDFKSQYLSSTFEIREISRDSKEWTHDWILPKEEEVPQPPLLDDVLDRYEFAIGDSDRNEETNRTKLGAILLLTLAEDKRRTNNLPFVRKSLSSPRPSGDMMRSLSVQFERKIEMPVTYNKQRRNLNGFMDYSFWYGDQANLEMNVIVVEAKPDGEASKGRHQLLVYMGMPSPRSFWIFIDIVLTLQQWHTLPAAMQVTGTAPLMEWRLMVTNSILLPSPQ